MAVLFFLFSRTCTVSHNDYIIYIPTMGLFTPWRLTKRANSSLFWRTGLKPTQVNNKWEATGHLWEWLKFRASSIKCWQESGMTKALIRCWQERRIAWLLQKAVSCKSKHTPTVSSSSHIPWYLFKGLENLGLHKSLQVDVYSSFILYCLIGSS